MKHPLRRFLFALPLLASLAAFAQPADVIFVNGKILTGEGLLSAKPQRVSALAVRNGRVVEVGADQYIRQHFEGKQTRLVDLGGAFVMPGFNDSHIHFGLGGFLKLSVDLTGARSLKEMQSRIGKAAAAAAPGTWLQGFGWDHTLWEGKTFPTRADLDAVTAGHPAIFKRIDGHIAVANTAALEAAGVTRATQPPEGGYIDLYSSGAAAGEPNGILRETAKDLVLAKVPPPTAAERRRALELACEEAVSNGLTSVQDNSEWEDFLQLQAMEREGRLPLRITEWLALNTPVATLIKQRASQPADDPLLRTGQLKGFMDGTLGSRSAALYAPYSDDPKNEGLLQYEQGKLNAMAIERVKEGFQLGFHAIGDRGLAAALDAFAAAEAALPPAPPQGRRYRVEHAQVVEPGDFARFAKLGVIASMQPNHLLTDMNWAEARLGPERTRYSYPWRSMLNHKVVLAFGTDYPVEPATPFPGLYVAVTRKNEAGTKSYHPQEKLTIYEALYAYTQGSAYAEYMESQKGKLAPGFLADFVVLDRDLTQVPAPQMLETVVLQTVVGGKAVYVNECKCNKR